MLSTPGCSEPDNLHDYQYLDSETDALPDLNSHYKTFKNNSVRRESGVSIASGIYEEIQEQPTEYYEELYSLEPGSLTAPPPLPPRRIEDYTNNR